MKPAANNQQFKTNKARHTPAKDITAVDNECSIVSSFHVDKDSLSSAMNQNYGVPVDRSTSTYGWVYT